MRASGWRCVGQRMWNVECLCVKDCLPVVRCHWCRSTVSERKGRNQTISIDHAHEPASPRASDPHLASNTPSSVRSMCVNLTEPTQLCDARGGYVSHWIRTTVLLLVGYCHHPTHSYSPSFIRLHVHRSSSLLSPHPIPFVC